MIALRFTARQAQPLQPVQTQNRPFASTASEVATCSNNGGVRIIIGIKGDGLMLLIEYSKHEKEIQSFHAYKL